MSGVGLGSRAGHGGVLLLQGRIIILRVGAMDLRSSLRLLRAGRRGRRVVVLDQKVGPA